MSRGIGRMATVYKHLSVEELEERYVGSQDATTSRHFQVIWLLARGHTISQVSETTAFGERWIEQLLARYNAEGPEALGDMRRRNGASATILKPDLLAKLRMRLDEAPPDGGLWSSRKVATWMAGELGLVSVAPQRGWEALKAIGWSIQKQKEEIGHARRSGGIQKKLVEAVAEEAAKYPDKPVEVFATDEHRIGLKPVTRRVWAPIGERPIAHGHHRFDWLYVTAFASPATGETFWYLSNGVSKEFFEALLETFAREAEAGLARIIVLVLDNAGWHGAANLKIPDGIRLIYLPPYSPEGSVANFVLRDEGRLR